MMKKHYLFLIILLSLQVKGQFLEGFENAVFPPTGWIVTDNGVGSTSSWHANLPPWPAYEGTHCAFIDRENVGIGVTSEEWLITPGITVGNNTPLVFYSRQSLLGDQGALYQVRISNTSQTDQSSFVTLANWTETTINPGLEYAARTVSLDAYAGETVYIAFVKIHTQPGVNTSGDRWLLDNVSVGANTVTGTISYSADGSCGATEPLAESIAVGVDSNTVFTNTVNGNYSYTTLANTVSVTPNFSNTNYFTITPSTQTVNFSNTVINQTANFCIIPNGVHPDLEVGIIPIMGARAGFDAKYKIIYKNKGTIAQSGMVTFYFNDASIDFVTASETPVIQTGSLAWNFTNLAPFESREITITLNLNSPTETPALNIGDILTYLANITSPATDETYLDNYATIDQVVVNSLDPNDKQVSVLSYGYGGFERTDLFYTIRFQNTGNFSAEKVVVADILSDKLNDSTLQMVSASHPYQSKYNSNTRKLEFVFDNINLPASTTDEPGSHGYVTFKIKPIETVIEGETVENTANIYFDFNAPVVTNTTSTIFYSILGTTDFGTKSILLYPNPAKNIVNINIAPGNTVQSVSIYNPIGQLVKTQSLQELNAALSIDVAALQTGTYFMEIVTNQGKTTKKFIKI